MQNNTSRFWTNWPKLLIGDWLVLCISLCCVGILFVHYWSNEPATKLRVRIGSQQYGLYSLQQEKTLHLHGHVGEAVIQIRNGQARFQQSPCMNQYCVHLGWLNKTGQSALCVPNQISLELLGPKRSFDTVNY